MTSDRIRSRAAIFGNGMFRALFLATLGSGVGTYAATIALTADIASRTHSTWWVSLLFIVTFLRASSLAFSSGRSSTGCRGRC